MDRGKIYHPFEEKWGQWNNLPSVATSSWAGAALAALDYFNIRGKKVLCPTNTFMATPLSVVKSGGQVILPIPIATISVLAMML